MCAGCRDDAARPRSNISWPRPGAAATCARLRFARRAAWPFRARCALRLSLPAGSWPSWSREIDDLATRSQIASTASAGPCRRTCGNVLAGLIGDEIVEIGIGEHAPAEEKLGMALVWLLGSCFGWPESVKDCRHRF